MAARTKEDAKRRSDAAGGWVGHYGCNDRLVKVVTFDVERTKLAWYKPKPHHKILCPSCGTEHTIDVWWRRPRKDSDELDHGELEL